MGTAQKHKHSLAANLRLSLLQVCLAQKWIVSKAQLAGKPVFVAGQMLPSMMDNPRPTRAEMTDTANAVFDGVDGIVLTGETARGHFASACVKTAAKILTDAEVGPIFSCLILILVSLRQQAVFLLQVGVDHYASFNWTRNMTAKPTSNCEAICSSGVKAAIDMGAALIAVTTNSMHPVRMLAKYR